MNCLLSGLGSLVGLLHISQRGCPTHTTVDADKLSARPPPGTFVNSFDFAFKGVLPVLQGFPPHGSDQASQKRKRADQEEAFVKALRELGNGSQGLEVRSDSVKKEQRHWALKLLGPEFADDSHAALVQRFVSFQFFFHLCYEGLKEL
jgi:hypothetical protein